MNTDLVDRLRAFAADCRGSKWQSREKTILLCDSAADEIAALQARVAELEAELVEDDEEQAKWIGELTDDWIAAEAHAESAEAYAAELEAKLAKAVRLISEKPILATYEDDVQWQKYVIAELTGGKDE